MLKFGGSPCLLSGRKMSGRRGKRLAPAHVDRDLPDPGRAQESEQPSQSDALAT